MRMILFPDCFARYFGAIWYQRLVTVNRKKTKKKNKPKPKQNHPGRPHSLHTSFCKLYTSLHFHWQLPLPGNQVKIFLRMCTNWYARGYNKTLSQPIISDLLYLYLSQKIRSSLLRLLRLISTSSKPPPSSTIYSGSCKHIVTLAIYPAIGFHVFKIYIYPTPSLGLSWN